MVLSKLGLITSLPPWHVPSQALTKLTVDAPSATLCETHTTIAIPPHSKTLY